MPPLTVVREGFRHPVWPGLITVAVLAGAVTGTAERWALTARPGLVDVALLCAVAALLAAVGCAVLAAVAAAAVGRVRGSGAGTTAGLLALAATTVGVASAHLPLRGELAARIPTVELGSVRLVGPAEVFLLALVWALPWPALGAARGGRTPTRDVWQLVLDLATADLPVRRAAWGEALRAELAAIDEPGERRRFALSAGRAALRAGPPHGTWLQAGWVAAAVAGGTFAASRWSLAHDRSGILDVWITLPAALLFVAALVSARRAASFGMGLRTGAATALAALVAVLAVGLPEAVVWAERQAGYLSTGDAVPPTWQAAALDVVRPEFLLVMAVFWAIGALGGAATGVGLGRVRLR